MMNYLIVEDEPALGETLRLFGQKRSGRASDLVSASQ